MEQHRLSQGILAADLVLAKHRFSAFHFPRFLFIRKRYYWLQIPPSQAPSERLKRKSMPLKSFELGVSKNKLHLTMEKFDDQERNPEKMVDSELAERGDSGNREN
jgi:hypothetical protein